MGRMRMTTEVFPEELRNLWSKWELRVSILISLSLQMVLIMLGSRRKRDKAIWLSVVLWLAYLLADGVAIFALGVLSNIQGEADTENKKIPNPNNALLGFWAPFLLLHLGGPDTITAYSLEDNELWRRHLLGLASQVIVSIYAFIRSLSVLTLVFPTCFMFITGIIKYGERTWALRYASREHLREVMLAPMAPNRNYVQILEKYDSNKEAGLPAKIDIQMDADLLSQLPLDTEQEDIDEKSVLTESYRFFNVFKRLIVDLMLSSNDRNDSRAFFIKRSPTQAFQVIQVELGFFYTELYTKAVLTNTRIGYSLRLSSFVSIVSALLLFMFTTKKHGFDETDLLVTYILLVGALLLEIYAFVVMFFSDGTMVRLLHLKWDWLWRFVDRAFRLFHRPEAERWSNTMGQYNLIKYCLRNRSPTIMGKVMKFIRVKDMWDRFLYTTYDTVSQELKDFLFKELKQRVISCNKPKTYKRLYDCKGEWGLERRGYLGKFNWSIELDFDESILIWHIATDLCYFAPPRNAERNAEIPSHWLMIRQISNYMLYIMVQLPTMLTAGIGEIRFTDTCTEVMDSIKGDQTEQKTSNDLYVNHTNLDPAVIRGDRNKSVLYNAGKLAHELRALDEEERWMIISAVWVEMLAYAASHCKGYSHSQQLAAGGELLTHLWLLMAHMGIAEQYRVEASYNKAKLIVEK